MAPALALKRALGRNALVSKQPSIINSNNPSICLFCSLSATPRRPSRPFQLRSLPAAAASVLKFSHSSPRFQSTDLSEDPYSYNRLSPAQLRAEITARLQELQSQFPKTIEPNRLKLALRSLSEPPGQESIRIAILNPEPNVTLDATAKQLVRAVLADELSEEAVWEKQLAEHDLQHNPLIIRVQPSTGDDGATVQGGKKDGAIPEIVATSPTLGRFGLELMISRVSINSQSALEDSLLVPKVHRHGSQEIDLDSARETSNVATPVHYTLLVRKGLEGALGAYSLKTITHLNGPLIEQAVDFKTPLAEEDIGSLDRHVPFISLNVDAANKGLEAMRAGDVDSFKNEWLEGNASRVRDWLKEKCGQDSEGGQSPERTKPAVRALIQSLLQNATAQVSLNNNTSPFVKGSDMGRLHETLKDWAGRAHEELQVQLTIASTRRSWRKLSWWKLFWRADDVGRITSDMVAEHFLPEAEKNIIHLAGRIDEAVTKTGKDVDQRAYEGPDKTIGKWPTEIPYTRNLIQEHTVPSLQALAQKLVIRSAGISGLSAGLAALSYFYSAGAYECGSIAALGVILSFRQIQSRWEKAQRYWENEVQEEGRKAIRATEASINGMLNWASEGRVVALRKKQEEDAERAREIIQRAQEALKRL
ncbi:hypothetical protein QBC44DRAFT_328906 [Cladorrhinum sp. PSN332]|nr:hypothetical protein QBC44DRAFT_328906 [Cladorrhinum sp. PSN332]